MAGEDKVPTVRADGLQLEEHRHFQERYWKAERAAWLVFGLIVVAALVGLTGSGGFFASSTLRQGEIQVEYPQIGRWQTSDELTIRLGEGARERRIGFSQSFFERFQIEDVRPEPLEMIAGPDHQTLIVKTETGAGATVHFQLRPSHPGFARYTLTIDDAPPIAVTSIVLP